MTKLTRQQLLQLIESARGRGEKPELLGPNLSETEHRRTKLSGQNLSEAEHRRANLSGAELWLNRNPGGKPSWKLKFKGHPV